MNPIKIVISLILALLVSACDNSSITSSGSGSSDQSASKCVTRTLSTVYTNECRFKVNVILIEAGARPFGIGANSAVTRPSSSRSFGVCEHPSTPVLTEDNRKFYCE